MTELHPMRTKLRQSFLMFVPRLTVAMAGVTTGLLAVLIFLSGLVAPIERVFDDLRAAALPSNPSQDVAVIIIDIDTFRHVGASPLPRNVLAKGLDRLFGLSAKKVLLDYLLADEIGTANDHALKHAIERFGPERIALTSAIRHRLIDGKIVGVNVQPTPYYAKHATVVGGSIRVAADGRLRRIERLDDNSDNLLTSAEWLAGKRIERFPARIDYGIDSSKIEVHSFKSLLTDDIQRSDIENRRVVIGVARHVGYGVFAVPLLGHIERPLALALAAESIAGNRIVDPLSPVLSALVIIGLSAFIAVWGARLGMFGATALAIAAMASVVYASIRVDAAFNIGLPTAAFIASILFGTGVAIATIHPAFARLRKALLSWIARVDVELAQILHSSDDAILTICAQGRIISANRSAQSILEMGELTVVGASLVDLLPEIEHLQQSNEGKYPQGRVEARLVGRNGVYRHLELVCNSITRDGEAVGFVSLRDITARKERELNLERLAFRDPLTNLSNRASFEKALVSEERKALQNNDKFAVLMLDLDRFKHINDTFGHEAGDVVLRVTASRFASVLRQSDFIARLGGDEFAVIMDPGSNLSEACRIADRMRDAIDEPIIFEGAELRVGTSIGIACFGIHSDRADRVLRMADAAMYRSKRNGLNYCVADSDGSVPTLDRLAS